QIFNDPFGLPTSWSLANYAEAWGATRGYLFSSLTVTLVSTVSTVLISAWAAFGLTRTKVPGQPLIVAFILGGMMLSPTVALVPFCSPILISCIVLHILFAWNEYLFAMIFTNSPGVQTLPVGLTSMMSKQGTNFAALFAAMTISALPIVILFFLTQRYFIRGL